MSTGKSALCKVHDEGAWCHTTRELDSPLFLMLKAIALSTLISSVTLQVTHR